MRYYTYIMSEWADVKDVAEFTRVVSLGRDSKLSGMDDREAPGDVIY